MKKFTDIINFLIALVGIILTWGALIAIIIVTLQSEVDIPTKVAVILVVVVGLGFIPWGFTAGFISFIRNKFGR